MSDEIEKKQKSPRIKYVALDSVVELTKAAKELTAWALAAQASTIQDSKLKKIVERLQSSRNLYLVDLAEKKSVVPDKEPITE